MRVVRLHATDVDERKRLRREVLSNPGSFDVAVTTYDMVNSAQFGGALKTTLVWRVLVLDEGHKIKNTETLVSQRWVLCVWGCAWGCGWVRRGVPGEERARRSL